jgi:regulator of protease activity HflC (stomatin/prohibitin superfamily)
VQCKLEAEARKEATIQNAQADAEAKVIDSKAELQRRNLLADAEASRVRLMAAANAERMTSEAELLNKSPLLINKIVAERLSDKIQVLWFHPTANSSLPTMSSKAWRTTPS